MSLFPFPSTHANHRDLTLPLWQDLVIGMRSDDVKLVQRLLNRALSPSPNLTDSGVFDSQTEIAVMGFQTASGMEPNCVVTSEMLEILDSYRNSDASYEGFPGRFHEKPRPINPAPKPNPPVTRHGGPVIIRNRDGHLVPHFKQWEYGAQMGRSGCAVASMAMVMSYYGRKVDPGSLYASLHTCTMNWDAACCCGGGNHSPVLTTEWDVDTPGYRVSSRRPRILARVAKGLPTVAWVDYKGSRGEGHGDHFVVIVGVAPNGNLIMNDPAGYSSGALNWQDHNNRIETCDKKYKIVGICAIDAT